MKNTFRIESGIVFIQLRDRERQVVAEAMIDEADLPSISQYRWSRVRAYVYTDVRIDGRRGRLSMHRAVMGACPGDKVDHINGNGLDNRRINLRPVTKSQNQQNRHRPNRNSSTGVRNCFLTPSGTFTVRISVNGVTHRMGSYRSLDEAAQAASETRRRIHSHCPENSLPKEAIA